MSFVRPQARRTLVRWREAGAGAVIAALCVWWATGAHGGLRWVAWVAAGVAFAVAVAGTLRALRPQSGDGAGVVVIDERQVTYLSGPGGGVVSLDRLARVEVEGRGPSHAPLWHLRDADGNAVAVPADALGAEALFDALSSLPGMGAGMLLRASRRRDGRAALWTAAPRRIG